MESVEFFFEKKKDKKRLKMVLKKMFIDFIYCYFFFADLNEMLCSKGAGTGDAKK